MPLSREQLSQRIEHEIGEREHVAVSPGVTRELGLASRGDTARASLAIVWAEAVAPNGAYRGDRLEVATGERWLVMLHSEAATPFVEACDDAAGYAGRILSDVAVLDIDPQHGLVLTELAAGHSARQLQTRAAPTLHVASTLRQMVVGQMTVVPASAEQ
jgi:hypothetical protein